MKFARLLRTTAEDLPELQCLFHIYKHLKKQLKQLPARSEGKVPGADLQSLAARTSEALPGEATAPAHAVEADEEARFTAVLTDHLQRLNDRFLEREETCVIQLERLEAEAAQCSVTAKAATAETAEAAGPSDTRAENGTGASGAALKAVAEQRAQLYKRFVNFHGEVLLLVHWSVLAYTATVKILKKHHKRTGLLLRAPQLADLLSQPFCSSELMTGLARKAEACIQRLAEQLASSATSGATEGDGTGDGAAGGGGGGGGPQDTVDQAMPGGAAAGAGAVEAEVAGALGTAVRAGPLEDDSYDMADGSSPSCSQSLGDLPVRRGCGQEARAHAPPLEPQQPQGEERVQKRQRQQQALAGPGGGAAAGGGGGASFLRNLARLSDNNSAASLSGPYVLEQLAELQQFVDKYDKMDEDDLDGLDEEDSRATGSGAAAAAATAGAPAKGHARGLPAEVARAAEGGTAAAALAAESARGAAAAAAPGAGAAPLGQAAAAAAGTSLPAHAAHGAAAVTATAAGPPCRTPPSPSPGVSECLGLQLQPQLYGERDTQGGDAAGAAAGGLQPPHQQQQQPQQAGPPSGRDGGVPFGQLASGSGSGHGSAPAEAQNHLTLPQSSSGSAGAAGGAGSVSVAVSEAFAATRPQSGAANLLRRTQVALTMWEQLRTNASTPSTVIDPAAGQQGHSQGGGGAVSKRRRLAGSAGELAALHRGEAESVADDSGSNSD